MEDAINEMNGVSLDGRSITVDKAHPQSSGRDRDGGCDYNRDHDRDRGGRSFGGGRDSGSGDCFKFGKPGHFARECSSDDGAKGDRYGSKDERYGGSGGSNRYGSDHGRDHYGGCSKDHGYGGSGSDLHNRDHSGPYERPSGGSYCN